MLADNLRLLLPLRTCHHSDFFAPLRLTRGEVTTTNLAISTWKHIMQGRRSTNASFVADITFDIVPGQSPS
jgi:hypothetical protein